MSRDLVIIRTARETQAASEAWRRGGLSVGVVPTMGALHEGHLSLIRRARAENDRVVVTIFVNPLQFGPKEDFASYPRMLERDAGLCRQAGADAIYAPEVGEMYPSDASTAIDVGGVSEGLCGTSRPGHFRGVATVVAKLFNLTKPHRAYFGQKDAQQVAVIRRMARDLNFDLEIVPCPIVREPDGLAMSSRNLYLSIEQRQAALVLSRSLNLAAELYAAGERSTQAIEEAVRVKIGAEPLARIDYVALVDAETIQPLEKIDRPALLALAVFVGTTRLIDNCVLGKSDGACTKAIAEMT